MSKLFNVVIVGPSTMVGEAVLALLEEREFPVGQIYTAAEDAGGRVAFKNGNLKVEQVEGFDFSLADIAFFCVDEDASEEYVPRATAAGCIVVDDSPCFRLEDDVPLVVPEVNHERLGGYTQRHIVSNPSTCALMLATVLKPLADVVGITHVNAVTMQAASGRDQAGVEELARQATAMFNLQTIESKVFPAQIAFNLIPQIGGFLDDGSSREEVKLLWETQKLLNNNELKIDVTAVRVPVFHGHSMVLHIELNEALGAESARNILANTDGIKVIDELEDGEYPTPVSDVIGHDAVFVGRIRNGASGGTSLNLWVVADNVRMGAGLNSVKVAECLVKEYIKQ